MSYGVLGLCTNGNYPIKQAFNSFRIYGTLSRDLMTRVAFYIRVVAYINLYVAIIRSLSFVYTVISSTVKCHVLICLFNAQPVAYQLFQCN